MMMKKFFTLFIILTLLPFSPSLEAASKKRMVILGFDGMDPVLLQQYMDQGLMPNFKRFLKTGGSFQSLETSYPPQSPVAWSNFAIGTNPGKHGIFDFVHRDPKTILPYFSSAKTTGSERLLKVGSWQIPFSGGSVENLRRGDPFWNALCQKGIPSTICQLPANYPPNSSCHGDLFHALSGMGTPDLVGTQGSFSYYTSEETELTGVIGGGKVFHVTPQNGKVEATLYGPYHPYKNPSKFKNRKEAKLQIPFTVWFDSESDIAKLKIGSKEIILKEGEFSDWVELKFSILPLVQNVSGIVRFLYQGSSPNFRLYVSPINIDPSNPAAPIASPESFSKNLYDAVGHFYTQNMPPDTKALEHHVLSDDEFLKQSKLVYEEEEERLYYELERFQEGLLFHYFSIIDQLSHVFWRAIDPQHPLYTPELGEKYGHVIRDLYVEADRIFGNVLNRIDNETLMMIVSDHGFTSFRWGVNLNTILLKHGFISLKDPAKQGELELFQNVDWRRTKAYNLGINAIYINLKGREKYGAVKPKNYHKVREEVIEMLSKYQDSRNGRLPVKEASRREDVYKGPYLGMAPDVVVGFDKGYRASWDTILGKFPKEEVVDNNSPWSGDHAIYFDLVPGVLLVNRPISKENPKLLDVAATLLNYFDVSTPSEMDGSSFLRFND